MRLHAVKCLKCEAEYSTFIDGDAEEWSDVCLVCRQGTVKRVWRKAPVSRIGGVGSDRQIKSMQKSFKERFYKKEIDDVRQKHGGSVDDAIRAAKIEKVKSGQMD